MMTIKPNLIVGRSLLLLFIILSNPVVSEAQPIGKNQKVPNVIKTKENTNDADTIKSISVRDCVKNTLNNYRHSKPTNHTKCQTSKHVEGEEDSAICLKLDWPEIVFLCLFVVFVVLCFRTRKKSSSKLALKNTAHHSTMNIKKEWMHMLVYPAVLGAFLEQMMTAFSPIIGLYSTVNDAHQWEGVRQLLILVLTEQHFLLGFAFVCYFSIDFLFSYLASTTENYGFSDMLLDLFLVACLLFGFISLHITDFNSGKGSEIRIFALLSSAIVMSVALVISEFLKIDFFIRVKSDFEQWVNYYVTLFIGTLISCALIRLNFYFFFYKNVDQLPVRFHFCFMMVWTTWAILMLLRRRSLGFQDEVAARKLANYKKARIKVEKIKKLIDR
ncbi:hypothetical protein [Flavobacterium sp.]|uniref:hypothetical protein n=1 Tax=Flavobacterium sp. TaxID=239 RepID=UPI00286C734E|nr:hypothetical protein [Flavobacterium sp.]